MLPHKRNSIASDPPWQVPNDNLVYHDRQETFDFLLKSAYRQILVDEMMAYLRLCVFFDDPPTCKELAVYNCASWDFGDALAGV